MRRILAIALLAALSHAQELTPQWQDDFGHARDVADVGARWSLEGTEWRLESGRLVAAGTGTLRATPLRAPEAGRQVIEAEFTIRRRLSSAGWAVAGLQLQQDHANYWQLAICEGPPPERQRYVELGENFRGTWKANSTGTHALQALPTKGSFAWEYSKTYHVRLAIDGKTIRGSFLDDQGKLLGEVGYELQAGQCVASGHLGLRFLGLEAAVDNVTIQAEPPPDAADLGVAVASGPRGRVALLADQLPDHDPILNEFYAHVLRQEGFGVTPLTGKELAKPGVLTSRNFEILALVRAGAYPASATDSIRQFLREGGHLLTVGGKPFSEPCVSTKDGWLTRSAAREQLRQTSASHLLLSFDAPTAGAEWKRSSNNVGKTASAVSHAKGGAAGTQGCAVFDIRGYSGWDTFAKSDLAKPFPAGDELTCFWLKAAPQTKEIAVEWREHDGTRWIATVPATTAWQRVVLAPSDFQFWKQGSPEGRGGGGDRLNPQVARQLSIGLAGSHTSIPKGDHVFWIDELGTAPWPLPREALADVEALDLGMFSDAYPWERLNGLVHMSWEPLVGARPGMDARLTGPAVLGFPKLGRSVFRPLLAGWDSRGRRRANAGGMLIHHGGVQRGARWAVFTPADPKLLMSRAFASGVATAASRLVAPVCLIKTAPERLTYQPGKTCSIPVTVRSFAANPVAATVGLQVLLGKRVVHEEVKTVDLRPLRSHSVPFAWQTPSAPGSYTARIEVRVDGELNDVVDEPFEVALPDPGLACRGPLQLSTDGKHIVYPDGTRFFCIGANYTGAFEAHGRFFGDEHFSPRILEAHFAASRDAGINVWRSCGWCWSAIWADEILRGDFRKVDLYMEFATRYGVYQLITPPGVHEFSLAKRLAVYTALAKHLRGHPALLGYDLQNEPEVVRLTGLKYPAGTVCPTQEFDFLAAYPELLKPKLAELRDMARKRRFWRNALSPELTEEQAFHVVCAAYLYAQWRREYGITFSTFPEINRAWPPAPKWKPLIDAIDAGLEAYVRVQAEALRAADPKALVTVGYNQCLSVFPGNRHLDFVSQHVYQRPYRTEDVVSNITTMDRLAKVWPDKPITLGEFGYTSGIELRDGTYLSIHQGAVGEMTHWLYAIDRGYDGCKKWVLNDHPLPYMHYYGNWAGRGLKTQIYEERFGIYAWDGSPTGRRKPIGIALAALRRYIDRAGPVGKLEIRAGTGKGRTAYRFVGDKALFIGGMQHAEDGLQFESETPLTLVADWGRGPLSLTATADVTVKVDTRKHLGLPPQQCAVEGGKAVGEFLVVSLLAGQTAAVTPRP